MSLLSNFQFVSHVRAPEQPFRILAAHHKSGGHYFAYCLDQREFPSTTHFGNFVSTVQQSNFPMLARASYMLNDVSGKLTFLFLPRMPNLREISYNFVISPEQGFYFLLDILACTRYIRVTGRKMCKICPENIFIGSDLRCYILPAELAIIMGGQSNDPAYIVRDAVGLYLWLVFGVDDFKAYYIESFRLPKLIHNVLTQMLLENDYLQVLQKKTVSAILEKRLGLEFLSVSAGNPPYESFSNFFKLINGLDTSIDDLAVERLAGLSFSEAAELCLKNGDKR